MQEIALMVPGNYVERCEREFVLSGKSRQNHTNHDWTSAEFFRISTGGMVKRGFDYPPNGQSRPLSSSVNEGSHSEHSGQAAQSAGIHPVSVIKEPEAVAIYAIRTLDYALEKNDAFIVCDAGGGTVDLISYEVEATLPRPRVREIVPAGGMVDSFLLPRVLMLTRARGHGWFAGTESPFRSSCSKGRRRLPMDRSKQDASLEKGHEAF